MVLIPGHRLVHFASLAHLIRGDEPQQLHHPTLRHPLSLYAMESRTFALSSGSMSLLYEIVAEHRGNVCPPRLALVQGLEGLGIVSVVPGPCNRLGVVTDVGDVYILEKRSLEPELVDIEDVRLLGLGSDFDVVVTDTVLMRREGDVEATGWTEVKLAGRVEAIQCSRWGTIVTVS